MSERNENGQPHAAEDLLTLIRDVSLSQSVLLTDPHRDDNPIIYCTHAFTRLTGYEKDEIYGRDCRFLQGPATDPRARAALREAIDAARPVEVESLNYRKDGTPFWQRLQIRPIQGATGELRAFLGIQTPVDNPLPM